MPLLVPLFISAFRRADELAVAMECRCYHGGEGRTRMRQLRFQSLDLIGPWPWEPHPHARALMLRPGRDCERRPGFIKF